MTRFPTNPASNHLQLNRSAHTLPLATSIFVTRLQSNTPYSYVDQQLQQAIVLIHVNLEFTEFAKFAEPDFF